MDTILILKILSLMALLAAAPLSFVYFNKRDRQARERELAALAKSKEAIHTDS